MAGIIKEISEQNASELVELATRTFYDTFGSYYDDKDFDQFFKDPNANGKYSIVTVDYTGQAMVTDPNYQQ
ncbi:hypothetical protein D3C62_00710 [Staphylococcus aureus]|nr:hypothetical protein [Staphylococcus aureus]MPR40604.1 hypothetical protein [Staphylococcus aureus]MPR43316.1 hypothetical protein [Staphylococcus aureus]MPR46184.1 hypothetical protein [Staphylococcus aureus]MPR68888.1 hypothetical protein [Staphylococcus aureus]